MHTSSTVDVVDEFAEDVIDQGGRFFYRFGDDSRPVTVKTIDVPYKAADGSMAKKTFTDKLTLGRGADQIDLYYFGPGHTNGDAWVVFPALRIVHSGDIFAGTRPDAPIPGATLVGKQQIGRAHV